MLFRSDRELRHLGADPLGHYGGGPGSNLEIFSISKLQDPGGPSICTGAPGHLDSPPATGNVAAGHLSHRLPQWCRGKHRERDAHPLRNKVSRLPLQAQLVLADNPVVVNVGPPIDTRRSWYRPNVAYGVSKFGMGQCVLGMAGELADKGVAVNALWPHSVIATAAISNVLAGEAALAYCRSPQIMADAAAAILAKNSREFTGNFCVDDVLLAEEGVTDFSVYRMDADKPLWSDFFVPEGTPEIEPLLAVTNPTT